ncbi:MAG: HAD-IIA family hydrolase [Dermatophilaceae bacterium]
MSRPIGTILVDRYAGLVCDLDGVVYRGPEGIGVAIRTLNAVHSSVGLVFATNNASRTPEQVSEQLLGLGLAQEAVRVVTSAQAGAAYLRRDLPAGSSVLAVGGEGVAHALAAAGLVAVLPHEVASTGAVPAAVLQGWGLDVAVRDLAAVCRAVTAGARWVATNSDPSLPVAGGVDIPGNGTLVAAVTVATRHTPEIVGKPHRPLYDHAVTVLGMPLSEVLAIGDRLDTDILGAEATGMDSLWVLTGVDGFVQLLGSRATPTYAAASLEALRLPPVEVCRDRNTWTGGPARVARVAPGRVIVETTDQTLAPSVANAVAMVGLAVTLALREELERDLVSHEDATEIARTLDRAVREAVDPSGQ